MSEVQKIIMGVVGAFIIGFIFVGASKEKPSTEQMEAQAKVRNYAAMQSMASEKCIKAIKSKTGEQIFFQPEVKTDQENYVILTWTGDEDQKGGFKKAVCKFESTINGITGLVIDGIVIVEKKD